MNDERMQSVLEDWFKARDAAPDDVRRSARRVAERRPNIRQHSRWWPFPVLYRKSTTSTSTDMTTTRPDPIPASNGHTPTVIGRTQSMFSPAKAITAGAIVFALGGVLLIGQPFGQPGDSVPGAEADADAAAPVEVTGKWLGYDCDASPEYCTQEWSMSDPRLEGTFKWFSTEWKDPDSNPVTFGYTAYVIENEGGTWRGLPEAWVRLPGAGEIGHEDFVLVGEGGYEGLTLIARFADSAPAMRGFIIDDAFPLPPDFTATE